MPRTDTILRTSTTHVLTIAATTSLLLLLSLLFSVKAQAAPTTFTVTNTNDSGTGSLRQAIEDANTNSNPSDMDAIDFGISGSGVHRITLQSSLPSITEKVTIDGYTQTGAEVNTAVSPSPINSVIKIEIEANIGSNTILKFETGSEDSILRGVSIFGASQNLVVLNADGMQVNGNYIGTDSSGLVNPADVYEGIQTGLNIKGDNTTLGSLLPSDRNIVTNSATVESSGAVVVEASSVNIYGNFVGIGKDGTTDLGAIQGIILSTSSGSTIGGTAAGAMNLISGSSVVQITILGTTNSVIQSNLIGTDYTGGVNETITNGTGISVIFMSEGNLIGGTGMGEGNIIRGVNGVGVGMIYIDYPNIPMAFSVNKNVVLGNRISNIGVWDYFAGDFGTTDLGIDMVKGVGLDESPGPVQYFENQGPTPNDSGDSDTGPNNYLNTPVLKTAQQVGNELTITYDLDAADSPSNSYRVEFFANDESTIFGTGPAQELVGVVESSPNGTDLTTTFTVDGNYEDKALSATATAIDNTTAYGFGSTSELSRNISVGSETDFDSDGADDAVEDLGPNNGDGNNDGTSDRLQPTVTTYEIDSTGIYATFVTEGCSENGTVASIDVSSLPAQDGNYEYPYGLTDFTLNCSRGDTVDITKYIWDNVTPDGFQVRKYNPETNQYVTVQDSTITTETIAGAQGLKLTYSITDGGQYDDDQTANGIIVDPVGIATLASTTPTPNPRFEGVGVPNTGLKQHWLVTIKD
jgi:hypothetical protein